MAQNAISTETLLTGEDLLQMGDIGPCELIDGRVVSMSPTGGEHAFIEFYLGAELARFARKVRPGWVLGGEVGIYVQRNPDTVRAADVAFLSKERVPDRPSVGFLEIAPELIIEVMSPKDRWQDLRRKIEAYFGIGVEQVWIVEPEDRAMLVYTSPMEKKKFVSGEQLIGEGTLEGFVLGVADLFAG